MTLPLLILALPIVLLCLQLLAALPARQRPPTQPAQARPDYPRPALTILVPAHNEAAGIATTLRSIRSQLSATERLLVIADNCDDHTAAIARANGATVIERQDTARRGKAYALAFGLQWLAGVATAPDIVICIDADCTLDAGALDRLATRCASTNRPAQARYLMHAQSAPQQQIAEFAWRIKNSLRALGRERLGMACQLTGSGMAIPYAQLQTIDLQHHLAEDLALGLALAAQGHAPVYCHEAILHSSFPDNPAGTRAQRTRWEHGHLHLLLHTAPSHLYRAIRQRNWAYATLALDLCIPPLSLLLMLTALATILALITTPWALLPAAALALSLLATWAKHGRDLLPAKRLPAIARYILAKIPLYLRYLLRRQRAWISTRRD